MSRDCFVCLNNTKNKVCTTCECYAHYSCWGKYLKNFTNVKTYISDQEMLITVPLYAKCPQCNGYIGNLKPTTRSDTRFGRQIILRLICQDMMYDAEMTQDRIKRTSIFRKMFEMIACNKILLRRAQIFKNMIRTKLLFLYDSGEWKSANFYYLKIFGKQIK